MKCSLPGDNCWSQNKENNEDHSVGQQRKAGDMEKGEGEQGFESLVRTLVFKIGHGGSCM